MYQLVLLRRYLMSKLMPVLAMIAVALCAAMVLIVWSVMGGFLDRLVDTGRSAVGDVLISWPNAGFAHYDELVEMLEANEQIKAATPVVETFGMVNLPDGRLKGVQVQGIDPESFARVTDYEEFLWWRPIEKPVARDTNREDPRLADRQAEGFEQPPAITLGGDEYLQRLYEQGLEMRRRSEDGGFEPIAVLGIELSELNERIPGVGVYRPAYRFGRRTGAGQIEWLPGFLPMHEITLNMVPLDSTGRPVGVSTRRFPIGNEFRTGLFQFDESTVLVPLATAQEMLGMDGGAEVVKESADPFEDALLDDSLTDYVETGAASERVTSVLILGEDGVPLADVKAACERVYEAFEANHAGDVPYIDLSPDGRGRTGIHISIWEERYQSFINAVRQEIAMVLFILLFISFVAVFLILAIFWAMVSEKTRDIGILRAIGASRTGVGGVWVGYGAVIGVVGSVLGVALAHVIVWNINPIHDWIGSTFNRQLWNPETYYFTEIPNQVNEAHALIVFVSAIVLSVLGALIPAFRAARLQPVAALRFE